MKQMAPGVKLPTGERIPIHPRGWVDAAALESLDANATPVTHKASADIAQPTPTSAASSAGSR